MPNILKIPLTHVNIIHLLGIESLPLDERKEIVMNALELVETRVFNRVMDLMDNNQQKEFMELLEKEDEDGIAAFLEENEIDLMTLTEKEVEEVKQELLEITKE